MSDDDDTCLLGILFQDELGIYKREIDSDFINEKNSKKNDVEMDYIMEKLENTMLSKDSFWKDGKNSFYTDEPFKCVCNKIIKKVNTITSKTTGRKYYIGSTCVTRLDEELGKEMIKKFNKLDRLKLTNLTLIDNQIDSFKQRIKHTGIHDTYNSKNKYLNKKLEKCNMKIDLYVEKQHQTLKTNDKRFPEVVEYRKSDFDDITTFMENNTIDTFKDEILSCKCDGVVVPLVNRVKKDGNTKHRLFYTCSNKKYNKITGENEGDYCKFYKFGYYVDDDDYISGITKENPIFYYERLKQEIEDEIEANKVLYDKRILQKAEQDKLDELKIIELEKSKSTINLYISVE